MRGREKTGRTPCAPTKHDGSHLDLTLRQLPSDEEIARRQEVFQQMVEDRKNTPPLKTPIVELIRQVREEWEGE